MVMSQSLSHSPINKNVGLCHHLVFQTRLPWLPQQPTLSWFSLNLFLHSSQTTDGLWLQLSSVSWWPLVCISLSSRIQKSSCLLYNCTWVCHRHCHLHKPKDECMNWSALPTCPTRPFIPPSSSPPHLVIVFHDSASWTHLLLSVPTASSLPKTWSPFLFVSLGPLLWVTSLWYRSDSGLSALCFQWCSTISRANPDSCK